MSGTRADYYLVQIASQIRSGTLTAEEGLRLFARAELDIAERYRQIAAEALGLHTSQVFVACADCKALGMHPGRPIPVESLD